MTNDVRVKYSGDILPSNVAKLDDIIFLINPFLWDKVYPIQVTVPPMGGNVRLLTWLSSQTAKR